MLVNLVIRSQNVIITIDGVLKLHTTDYQDTALNVTYHCLKSDVYRVKSFDHSKIDQMTKGYSCVHDFILYLLINTDPKTLTHLNILFQSDDSITCILYLLLSNIELRYREDFSLKELIQSYINEISERWRIQYWLLFNTILKNCKIDYTNISEIRK